MGRQIMTHGMERRSSGRGQIKCEVKSEELVPRTTIRDLHRAIHNTDSMTPVWLLDNIKKGVSIVKVTKGMLENLRKADVSKRADILGEYILWREMPPQVIIEAAETVGIKKRRVKEIAGKVAEGLMERDKTMMCPRAISIARKWGLGNLIQRAKRKYVNHYTYELLRYLHNYKNSGGTRTPFKTEAYVGSVRDHGAETAEIIASIIDQEPKNFTPKLKAEAILLVMESYYVKKVERAELDFVLKRAKSLWPGCSEERLKKVKVAIEEKQKK